MSATAAGRTGRSELVDERPRDFRQQVAGRCQLAFGRYLVSNGGIVGCLGFLHVGDRDQADLKALLRLFELSRDRVLVCVNGNEPVLGAQHVEVSLGNANDQILLRGLTVCLGLGDRLVRSSHVDDLVPAKDGLPQRELPVQRFRLGPYRERNGHDPNGFWRGLRIVEDHLVLDTVTLGLCSLPVCTEVDLRQVHAACLRFRLQRGQPACLRFVDPGITLQRLLVDLQQGGGLCLEGQTEHRHSDQ